jgi:PEP-CTERM motif
VGWRPQKIKRQEKTTGRSRYETSHTENRTATINPTPQSSFRRCPHVEIRTTDYPNGELRGQISAVPEPSTIALLTLAVAVVLAAKFRSVNKANFGKRSLLKSSPTPLRNALFAWSALAGQCLFDASSALRVWRRQTIKQTVWAGFEKLRQPGQSGHRKRKAAMLNRADGLHVNTCQFRQTLLCETGFKPSFADVSANRTKDFAVGHHQSELVSLRCEFAVLTPDNK